MKCPYQKDSNGMFTDCTVDCPACKYETREYTKVVGRKPAYMDTDAAIERGLQWRENITDYHITGCKFVDNLVKPTDQNVVNVNNTQKVNTKITTYSSIF